MTNRYVVGDKRSVSWPTAMRRGLLILLAASVGEYLGTRLASPDSWIWRVSDGSASYVFGLLIGWLMWNEQSPYVGGGRG